MTINKTCERCGDHFSVPAKGRAQRFCGRPCYYAHQRTIRGEIHPRFGKPRSAEVVAQMRLRGGPPQQRGADNPGWRGGRTFDKRGYLLVHISGLSKVEQAWFSGLKHPYVPEHRLVASRKLGRALLKSEHVHHINGVKSDNRDDNLLILGLTTHSREHWAVHRELAALRLENKELRDRIAKLETELGLKIPVAGRVA